MQRVLGFFGRFEEFNEKKVFWTAFWISVVVMLLHILFFHKVERDFYYTAMAREFGDGRYQYAFFAAIPPLLSVIAGSLMKIGISAFTAVKIVSAFFYIVGLFPFRALIRRISNEKIAAWACIVYVCSSYPIRYSVFGFPFALKMFFLIFSTFLVVKFAETLKLRYTVYLGFSLGLLALSRGECIGFVPLYILWFILLPLYLAFRKKELKQKINRILINQIIGLLLIFFGFIFICWPQMIFIYNRTGMPLTEARTAETAKRFLQKNYPCTYNKLDSFFKAVIRKAQTEIQGVKENKTIITKSIQPKSIAQDNRNKNVQAPGTSVKADNKNKERRKYSVYSEDFFAAKGTFIKPVNSYNVPSFKRNLKEAYKGLYEILLVFAFIGLFFKIRKKEFKIYDLIFLSVILYNTIMFLATIPVTKRYTAVAQPFEMGWSAIGGYYIYSWNKWKIFPDLIKKYWKFIMGVTFTVMLIIMLGNGFNRFTEELFTGNQYRTVGLWIRDHKELFPGDKYIITGNFHTNRLPVILDALPEYTFWAEGDHLPIMTRYKYKYPDIVKYMKDHNATVLILDDRMEKMCPDFIEHYKNDFVLEKDFISLKVMVFRLK